MYLIVYLTNYFFQLYSFMTKKNSSSSNRWLRSHFKDQYVKKVHRSNIRSRAWFKLHDIQLNSNFLKSGMKILDLGSSPGSWSEYAIQKVGKMGHVIACDVLPMAPIKNVIFFHGNVKKEYFLESLLVYLRYKKIDVVMSDMAPNMTGHYFIDHIRAMSLSRLALNISIKLLLTGGSLLVKSFYGQEFNQFIKDLRIMFSEVKIHKPNASRTRSKEVYILASSLKM